MKQEEPMQQQALFNAGVDTALQISKLAKEAEYFASIGDYPRQFLKFESMEMWMSPKFRLNEKALKEIKSIKEKSMIDYKKYLVKFDRNKKISNQLNQEIKTFLTDYGKCLMFYRDVFGYGMPRKDDARFAMG